MTRSAAANETTTDAISVLEEHHATIEKLFQYFQDNQDPVLRRAVAHRICRLVSAQLEAEEELLRPAAGSGGDFVRKVVAEVMNLPHQDYRLASTVESLAEYVQGYVEQQRRQIIPELKRDVTRRLSLGTALISRRAELLAAPV